MAGGDLDESLLADVRSNEYIIGVDRGAYWLLSHDVVPDAAIGDFDSVSTRQLEEIIKRINIVQKHPPEKDFTDLELALEYALSQHMESVTIYGSLGTRMDHTLAGIALLERFAEGEVDIRIVNTTNSISVATGETTIIQTDRYSYFSILPITDSAVVTLSGCKYPIDHLRIVRGQTIGISNEVTEKEVSAHVHEGKVLVIQSRD